jgi:hypothetical protein
MGKQSPEPIRQLRQWYVEAFDSPSNQRGTL